MRKKDKLANDALKLALADREEQEKERIDPDTVKTGKICFVCGEEIVGQYWLVPIEKPYVNLFMHKQKCYLPLARNGMTDYLEKNREKILSMANGEIETNINKGSKRKFQ